MIGIVTNPADGDAHVQLPNNVDAEAAFLGALLVDNRIIDDVQQKLRPEHFYEPVHRRLYEMSLKLIDQNVLANPITLQPYFTQDEALQKLGGTHYLTELSGNAVAVIGARDFADQIYNLALLRELVTVGRDLVTNALTLSNEVDPQAQIEQAEAALYSVAGGEMSGGGVKSFIAASRVALANAQRASASGGGVSGKTMGLRDLDAKMGGLHNSDLLILAGRPGMGKTALATNIAFNAAEKWMKEERANVDKGQRIGAVTAFFSLEMSADQLATRILAESARISSENLRTGRIKNDEMAKLTVAVRDLEELPLFIDDTPALTIAGLRARARRLQRTNHIGLIIVDYLQLLQGNGRSNDNRVNEISEISRGLKSLAKELNVPVIALSQLSRAVEQRDDKRPQLSDLRESGSIEQDADIVMFIYRDEYYSLSKKPDVPDGDSPVGTIERYERWEAEHKEVEGKATAIIAKQRHGSTGNVQLSFISEYTKFGDLARGNMPEDFIG